MNEGNKDIRVLFDPSTMNMEQEFERQMGFPFDPEKYTMSIEEGAEGLDDGVVSTLVISPKELNNGYDLNEVGRADFDPATMNMEQEFERQMGFPFDPEKYEIRVGEGSNGFEDQPYEELVFFEKVPRTVTQEAPQETQEESQPNPYENMSDEDINKRIGELWNTSISSGELEDGDPEVVEYHNLIDELNRRRANAQTQEAPQETQEKSQPNPYENMSDEDINKRIGELWNTSISSGELEDGDPEVIEYHNLIDELNRRRANAQTQEAPQETQEESQPNPYENMSDEDINKRIGELWNTSISSGELEDGDPEVVEYHNLIDELNRRRSNEQTQENTTPTRTDLTAGLSDEELLMGLMMAHNEMGSLTGQDPFIGIEQTDIMSDRYNLSTEQIELFNHDKAFTQEVMNVAPDVYKKYADLLKQVQTAREKIAEVMNIEPYPGIENEVEQYISDSITNQLDDWEIDQLRENKDKLDALKAQYPLLFANVRTRDNGLNNKTPNPAGEEEPKDEETKEEEDSKEETTDKPKEEDKEEKDPSKEEEEPEKDEGVEIPKPKKEFDKEKAKELLKKGLFFAGGFAVGMGFSCVPGVSAIMMPIAAVRTAAATAKLVNKGINAWTNKHPDGKVAKVVNTINNSKLGQFVENTSTAAKEKWDNSKIGQTVNNIKNKLKTVPIKYAINGMALGYLTGNMIEMFTGKTVLENITDKFKSPNVVENPAVPDRTLHDPTKVTPDNVNPQPTPQVTPEPIPTPDPTPSTEIIEEAIKGGQSVDISSLHYGGVSSVSNPIALNTAAGQHVLFDRAVILENGQEMWHMAQADAAGNLIGKGYAWFPKEQVIDAVQGLSQTGMVK